MPKRIARLNLRPSLKEPALRTIEKDTLLKARCFLVGFETSSKPSDFMSQKKMLRIELEPLLVPFSGDTFYRSRIIQNQTACYDDLGAAVICHIPHQHELQVGLFQSLATTSKRQYYSSPLETCSLAAEMRFTIITDDPELLDVIETHDLPGFVAAYKACEYI
ncbi:Protein F48E3.4 [Aphelenchoides avenae]|nr:Protein F48E3.4 [Aphelenchus avenae]